MKKLKIKNLTILICFAALFAVVMYFGKSNVVSKTDYLMDTYVSISAEGKNAEEAVKEAFSTARSIERKMSSHISTSDVSTGILSEETEKVVRQSLKYSKLTGGIYDITIKPLSDLWNITGENPKVPTQEEIDKVVSKIGYEKLVIENGTINMPVDLGSIAKGYAADQCAKILTEAGVEDAVIDFGGDIFVIGEKTVGIRNPVANSDSSYMGTVKVNTCAIVTSGVYERQFTVGNNVYHHLLNPFTGYPQNGDIISVTVIGDSCMDADAFATAIYLMQEDGIGFANENSVKAITLHKNGNVQISEPLKNSNVEFEIIDSQFYSE